MNSFLDIPRYNNLAHLQSSQQTKPEAHFAHQKHQSRESELMGLQITEGQ